MSDSVATLLEAYALSQPRRAAGGIYAMAGFAYQAEVAISRAVTLLVASSDFYKAGQVFVEALSDVAIRNKDGALVLLQVKRTLTAATLNSAAEEVAAIEAVDAQQAQPVRPCYGVVCQHRNIDLDWGKLPSQSPHVPLVKRLLAEGRLQLPQQLPNPRWQALAALWNCHSDPFEFLRFALDRIVHRKVDVGDASACWEALAERYSQGLVEEIDCGTVLSVVDVLETADKATQHLEVGKRVTWDRWRRGQYMRRPVFVGDAVSRILALREWGVQIPSTELSVYWLAGRSGAGKSVVLLNVVSDLVQAGFSVLWLKPDELEPALNRIAGSQGSALPDFLAVDDIFDPDARDSINLGRISALIDGLGAHHWPVLLTCGPSEFADDFAEQSRFQGFSMQAHEVPLLNRAETEMFVAWAAPHLGAHDPAVEADRWSGLALTQSAEGQGLFVSVATELASGDMKHFGQRFALRLRGHGDEFIHHIRVCLAVNRLYLRAPATWLSNEDRGHLEDINRDNDFALEASDSGQEWLRLTHPHLSDAIYPHLLQTARPRLFAEDLGKAFRQALLGGYAGLAQRLLLAFSAQSGHARAQRMQSVDEQHLAKLCVQAWNEHAAGGDIRLQAAMRVSMACWPAAIAWLAKPTENLIAEALQYIDQAEAQFSGLGWWSTWWQRLWKNHPDNFLLVNWATSRVADSVAAPDAAWSHTWEMLWHSAAGERRKVLEVAARNWLSSQGHRADWHFVWRLLHGAHGTDRLPLANLLANALPHESGGHWAHVWQEALLTPPEGNDLPRLVKQGCDWLAGREGSEQWAFVWQALLSQAHALPEGWSVQHLVEQGCDWLAGREGSEQWSYVWQALLSQVHALPEGWSEQHLVKQGCDWLTGREGSEQWAYVWRALLSQVHALPEGWSEQHLVKQGCDWLAGREDSEQWSYVWKALLSQAHALPEGWSERGLLSVGISLAEGGVNADIVIPLLSTVLRSRAQLEIADRQRADALVVMWLPQLAELAPGSTSHALEAMLDSGLKVLPGILEAARAWCNRYRHHKSWPLVLVKALAAWPTDRELLELAAELALLVEAHPNASWLYKAERVLITLDFETSSPALKQLLQCIRCRKESPAWQEVDHWIESAQEVPATVLSVGRHISVELAGGMLAELIQADNRVRKKDSLRVVVTKANRAFDRIYVRQAVAPTELPCVDEVLQCTVAQFARYGIFMRARSVTVLIMASELPPDSREWAQLLPARSQWKVRITKHTTKGFNGVIMDPPWAIKRRSIATLS
jgi:hypothetical protein